MLCALSLANCSPFHIAVRDAIVAKDISHTVAFVASGCRVCIKILWQCRGSSLWIKAAAKQMIFQNFRHIEKKSAQEVGNMPQINKIINHESFKFANQLDR